MNLDPHAGHDMATEAGSGPVVSAAAQHAERAPSPGRVVVPPGAGLPMRRLPSRRRAARTPPPRLRTDGTPPSGQPAEAAAPPTVSVVIPAKNEAANLPHVLRALPAGIFEVVLVDGRSTDDTVRVSREARPDIRVVTQTGRGKGDALMCGFAACRGDIIVMLDADGSADPAEIPLFVAALTAGADFAKGSRRALGGGSADFTLGRRMGNRALGAMVNVLFGTQYTDLCYGYNAFWAHCLPAIGLDCDGFEVETLINIRIAKAGMRVSEVPSFERERLFGASNLRVLRDGMRVLRTIVREWAGGRTDLPAHAHPHAQTHAHATMATARAGAEAASSESGA